MRATRCRSGQKGQAIVMVALSIFVIFGMLGLAVDLGWSYFRAKAARAVADAAALAAARYNLDNLGSAYSSYPTTTVTGCSSSLTGGLGIGCQYAQNNLFTNGSNGQTVTIEASTSSPYTMISRIGTANGGNGTAVPGTVAVSYWVRVRAAESIPQLFSGFLGNPTAVSSAFGTAAVVNQVVNGSLILLNGATDCATFGNGKNANVCGENLYLQGNASVTTAGNILMNSTCNGSNCNGTYAADGNGNYSVTTTSPSGTYIAGNGAASNPSKFTPAPVNGQSAVSDPMANNLNSACGTGIDCPPLLSNSLGTAHAVPGGDLDSYCSSNTCGPGYYYASMSASNTTPTGNALTSSGGLTFGSASTVSQYIFFGGLQLGASGSTNYTFYPGEYIFAGVTGANNSVFSTATNVNLIDGTSGNNTQSDMGEMFVFTDATSQGSPIQSLTSGLPSALTSMQFGNVSFASGNNGTAIDLHGLNSANSNLPTNLDTFAPMLFWQDQCNSLSPPAGCSGQTANPELDLPASPNVHLNGVVYQPKGAWTSLQGGGTYSGPLQLITGALSIAGNGTLDLLAPTSPLSVTTVSIIE